MNEITGRVFPFTSDEESRESESHTRPTLCPGPNLPHDNRELWISGGCFYCSGPQDSNVTDKLETSLEICLNYETFCWQMTAGGLIHFWMKTF